MSTAKQQIPAKEESMGGIILFLRILAIFWFACNIKLQFADYQSEKSKEQTKDSIIAYNKEVARQLQSQAVSQPVEVEREMSIQHWTITSTGTPIPLKYGWTAYPIHGNYDIHTPDGAVIHDGPGIVKNAGMQPEGTYMFVATNGTAQLDILNRW